MLIKEVDDDFGNTSERDAQIGRVTGGGCMGFGCWCTSLGVGKGKEIEKRKKEKGALVTFASYIFKGVVEKEKERKKKYN